MIHSAQHQEAKSVLTDPIKNVARLATGDFVSKALNFLTFVYLARVLGVGGFGVLEFANSALAYFLLLADGGLELWGTREAAKTSDVRSLAARIIPLRLILATIAFLLLLGIRPLFPGYPSLHLILALFALTLFPQALSLKWLFMGKERMARVAVALVVGQTVFTAGTLAFVHTSAGLVWVPVLRLVGDSVTAVWFAVIFFKTYGSLRLPLSVRAAKQVLGPALTLGTSQAMGLLNYNFDSVLLGFMASAVTVGWYNAAYKPVAVAVTLPMTYFAAMFPALSRSYANNSDEFRDLVRRSARLCSIFVVPVVVGGTLLAGPIVNLLYGSSYANSASPFRVLVWSAGLAILRCNYSNCLRSTGHQKLDLRCALASASVNVGLNFLLIPHYGMMGAAAATVTSDVVWLVMSYEYFQRELVSDRAFAALVRPLIAGLFMGATIWVAEPVPWIPRATLSIVVYFVVLLATGEVTVRTWVMRSKVGNAAAADPHTSSE